jgi:SAM-dependent methyltransferase
MEDPMTEMFARTDGYEAMMGRWSMRLAPLFLDFCGVRSGGKILDMGCGTGSLVHTLADRAISASIVGIDPSQTAIDYCRERFSGKPTTFDCGNGMSLPYADDAFDHSLSLLVFQFIPQPEKAAKEMRRVTRPGGTVGACTWDSVGGGMEMSAIFRQEAAKLDPTANARAERRRGCNSKGALEALWRATGLEGVEETAIEFRTNFTGFDDYWLPFTMGAGPQGVYVESLSADSRTALREQLRRRLLGDGPDGPFSLGARAWAVRGTVPLRLRS